MKLLLVSPQQQIANGGIAVWTNMFLNATKNTDIVATVLDISMIGRRLRNGSAKRSFFDEIKRTRRIFRDLRSLLKKEKYDVAHINTSCARFGIIRDYMVAKRIKKKSPDTKIILHCNCDIGYQIRSKRNFKYLAKLVGVSDIVMVLCDTSAEYIRRHFRKESVKIPNFIDSAYITTSQKVIREELKTVLFVGRVTERKGAVEIIEVAKARPDLSFRLVGAVGSFAEGICLPENVTLVGQLSHDEVLSEMDRADVFLFPTHSEGFSIALLESMARGLPAIATDVGANADMLSHGCGVIVQKGDTDAILSALSNLEPMDIRRDISEKVIERVSALYTTDKVIEQIKKCYRVYEEIEK